jgi:predicted regulator of Ras-like GTPase activity (Roadblock/LC7/MglB family)
VNEILNELNSDPDIVASIVILKTGMFVAGKLPDEVQDEIFITMASILISAAESATSGIKGKFENVYLELDRSKIIIENAGKKGALIVLTNTKENNGHISTQIRKAALSLGLVL